MADTTPRLLVPIPTACEELGGISRPTLYALVEKRELTKINIGRRGFITGESLAAFVSRRAEAATA
jgi:Helix-turn-helix domain